VVTQVTKDGKFNEVINGITDWVYEEEFGFVSAFEWSENSNYLAFLRFDEAKFLLFLWISLEMVIIQSNKFLNIQKQEKKMQ